MSTQSVRQRLTKSVLSATVMASLVPWGSTASAQQTVKQAEPAVPVPRSAPCEVQLFRDAPFPSVAGDLSSGPAPYAYAPPAGCPPPWAKVVLDMTLASGQSSVQGIAVELKGVTLFVGPTPDAMQPTHWRVRRDLTDYSALFKAPGTGALSGLTSTFAMGEVTGTATLRFYPPTAAQPAPHVPDAVYSVGTSFLPPSLHADGPPPGHFDEPLKELASLPHNIVRAYLDVTANDDAFWYTCFTRATLEPHPTLVNVLGIGMVGRSIFPHYQYCTGSSYSEASVSVDGMPAGVAPTFPWLPTSFSALPIFRNALDTPTDSVMSLGFVPYRLDLTPFAAILNEAGSHWVALAQRRHPDGSGTWYLAPRTANLLVYLDHGRTRVPGAVTFNSLVGGLPRPAVTDDLVQDRKLLQGRIRTRMDRDFEIRGYVDTSRGRVHSRVTQHSRFRNVQAMRIRDINTWPLYPWPEYRHDLWLESTTQSISRRTRNGQTLSEDRNIVSYPLQLHYVGIGRLFQSDGPYRDLAGGTIAVDQQRRIDVSHRQRGVEPYATRLREEFYGNHSVDPDSGASSHWHAAHTYLFQDDRGSCYQKVVTTRNGALDQVGKGMDCAGGQNRVRWFAHPDGSSDGLTWQHP